MIAVERERRWRLLVGVGLLAVGVVAVWAGVAGYQEVMVDEAVVVPQYSYGGEFYPLEGKPLQGMTASIDRSRGLGWFHQGPWAMISLPGVWSGSTDSGPVYANGRAEMFKPNNRCRLNVIGAGAMVDCSPKLVRIVHEGGGKERVTVYHSLWSAAAKITRRMSLATQKVEVAWDKFVTQVRYGGNVPDWYFK